MTVNEIKKYRKKSAYSYSFGSFPTFELLQTKPEVIEMILVHSDIKLEIDIFHPKAVRASMGAVFQMNFEYFSCFSQYDRKYGKEREYYPFMLNGMYQLGTFEHPGNQSYSLIFGNEASGLEDNYLQVGKSVVIPHAHSIDSLNLSLAVGIGIYEFCKPRRKEGKNGG